MRLLTVMLSVFFLCQSPVAASERRKWIAPKTTYSQGSPQSTTENWDVGSATSSGDFPLAVLFNGGVGITIGDKTAGDKTAPHEGKGASALGAGSVSKAGSNGYTATATFELHQASTTDPGLWTGLWIPPNTNNVIVADQMSPLGAGTANFIPGCLNQQISGGTHDSHCSTKLTYTGTVYGTNTSATVVLANNNILSIRYTSNSNPNATYSSFLLGGGSGGNLPTKVNMWLSTSPGVAMISVPVKCQTVGTSSARISTGTGYCVVTPNTRYYLNIQVPATTCAACMFKLTDDSQFY